MLYKEGVGREAQEYVWTVVGEEVHELGRPDSDVTWPENHFTLIRSLGNGFYYKIPYGIRESLCKEVYKEE